MAESDDPRAAADRKAQAIRDRALELLAGASLHAQRVGDAATRLGLTPDLVDGLGDQLYEAAVAQLDIASKILERSQVIADRLFELGAARLEPSRLMRVDVEGGRPASLRFVVRNASGSAADVAVDVTWDGPGPLAAQIGRAALAADRETWVEVRVPADRLELGKVYAGTARIRLTGGGGRAIELPCRDFEIWVSP